MFMYKTYVGVAVINLELRIEYFLYVDYLNGIDKRKVIEYGKLELFDS